MTGTTNLNAEILHRFMYHGPKKMQTEIYEEIRTKGREFAYILADYCPEGRELDIALMKLEEVVMWANAAIARQI